MVQRTYQHRINVQTKQQHQAHDHQGNKGEDGSVRSGEPSIISGPSHRLGLRAHVGAEEGQECGRKSEGKIVDKHGSADAHHPSGVQNPVNRVVKVVAPTGHFPFCSCQRAVKAVDQHRQ